MIALDTRTECRMLREGERLPASLWAGFGRLDCDWCWVSEKEGRVIAAILAAPVHGIVFIARVLAEPGHGVAVGLLLRRFLADIALRGFPGYFTYLDSLSETENRLLEICKVAGGLEVAGFCKCVGGRVADAGRW